MTLHDPVAPTLGAATARLALPLFAVTLFASALLLFAVQPMFTKMVLPILGGAPSVWSVAMVFFQAALLVGYAYAHLLARTLPVGQGGAGASRRACGGGAHAADRHRARLRRAASKAASGSGWSGCSRPRSACRSSRSRRARRCCRAGSRRAATARRATPTSSMRPPTSARSRRCSPIRWRSSRCCRCARRPGSGRSALPASRLLVAVAAHDRGARAPAPRAGACAAVTRPTARDRLAWIVLAAIPAGLVIAVTAYISTDVAAAPLLWVLPLALYLLTFVAVFRDRPWFPHDLRRQARAVPRGAARDLAARRRPRILARQHRAQSARAVRCSRSPAMARSIARRPAPARLTEFYLWTSFGGVLGGIFAGLLAPHLFNGTYEYPILIVAALLALPGALAADRARHSCGASGRRIGRRGACACAARRSICVSASRPSISVPGRRWSCWSG